MSAGAVPSVNSGVIGPARLQAWRALTPRHHGRKVGKEPHCQERRRRRWKGYGDQQEEEEEERLCSWVLQRRRISDGGWRPRRRRSLESCGDQPERYPALPRTKTADRRRRRSRYRGRRRRRKKR